MRYSFGVRVLLGSYSVPSPWTATPLGHGAGIVGLASAAGVRSGGGSPTGARAGSTLTRTGVWAASEINPSFLALAADGAVWAVTEPEQGGELLRFAPGRGGWPSTAAPARVTTGADAPCHLALGNPNTTGGVGSGAAAPPAVVFVSHYHGGVVTAIVCDAAGLPERVAETITLPERGSGWDRSASRSRPHSVLVLPGSDGFLVADCGRDLIALCTWDRAAETATLRDVLALAPGTGPRHLARHAASGTLYASNQERGGVTVFTRENGRLRLREHVPGPGRGRARPVPSEIAVHPDGSSVVLANRVDDSLTVYAIAKDGGLTERVTVDSCGGTPRHFAFTPDGAALLVAHQDSDELVVFRWEDGRPVDPSRTPVATPTAVLALSGN